MREFKIVSVVAGLALLGVMFVSAPAAADTPTDKLKRGVIDVVTSLIEIPATIKEESTATNPVQGLTVGLIKGAFRVVKRSLVGVYEIVTFPYAGDSNYEPILDPEYAWSRFD